MKLLICYTLLSVSSLMISMASALTNHWVIGRSSCHLVSQLVSSVFLSHQISISHQPPASQQYFSLTTNQHQLPATAKRTQNGHN